MGAPSVKFLEGLRVGPASSGSIWFIRYGRCKWWASNRGITPQQSSQVVFCFYFFLFFFLAPVLSEVDNLHDLG